MKGSTFTDPGATVIDNYDNDVELLLLVLGYRWILTITYTATDIQAIHLQRLEL